MRHRAYAVVLGGVLAAVLGGTAWAYWTMSGAGASIVATGTLLAPANVSATAPVDSGTVAVTWTSATLGTGQDATGYYAQRIRNSDGATFAACGTSKAAPATALSCDDLNVVDGDYHYTVTSLFGSWTALSASSASVTVVNDSSLPTIVVSSISPVPNGNGWNNTSPVTVGLLASDSSGIASVTYAIDGHAPVTGTSSAPSLPVSGEGTHTVTYTAVDNVGKSSTTGTVIVRIDTMAPEAPSAPALVAASDTGFSSTDSITKVTAPTATGTAEDGSTVTMFDGATPVGTAVASGGTYTITSSTLSNGTHLLTARATDAAANTGPASVATRVIIDAIAPSTPAAPTLAAASDSGISSSDRITNVTTPTLTGSAEVDATVELYSSGTVVGSAPATDGTYAVTSATLADGTRTMTVRATDVAGNASATSPSSGVTIDTVAPVKPSSLVLLAASDSGRSASDRITSVTTPTFTGVTTAATTVTVYDDTTLIGSAYAATTAYSVVSSTLADASHVITSRATDAAGNLGPAATSITVVTDTVAPPAPSVPSLAAASDSGKSNSDRITNKTTPVFTGTNEAKAIVTLYDDSTQTGTVTTTVATYSVTSTLLGQGTHDFSATATDVAGNLGPASTTVTVTIDTTAPAAPSAPDLSAASDTGVSSSDRITKANTPTFTGTADGTTTVGLYDGATASGVGVTPAVGGAWSALTGALTNGSHSVGAKATDVAGNLSVLSATETIVVDTVTPTATLNQAAGQADPTTSSSIGYTLVCSEPVYGLTNADITLTGTAVATTATISGSGPTYGVLVSGMTKTGTVVSALQAAKVTDVAGNNNAAATSTDATVTYTDNVAPAAPSAPFLTAASDTGVSSTDGITKTTKPVFTGTAEVGSTVKLLDGVTLMGTVVATSGTWSITSTVTLTNGTHTITATATDPSGNLGPASDPTTITIDTVAPTVTLNQAAGQADPTTVSPINFTVTFNGPVVGFTGPGLTLTGTALPGAFVITGPGPSYNVAVSGMTKSGTVIPSLAAGAAQDLAGNASIAATFTDRTVTFADNVAPTLSITDFSASTGTSQTVMVGGTASFGFGDNLTLTVVLCTTNTYPCTIPSTKATLSGVVVNATTGEWAVTSAALGVTPTLYARATQTDLTANTGNSNIAGPVAVQ